MNNPRPGISTPEFIRWALELPCALRMGKKWSDPEQTERQLRSLRAYSDAVREDRTFERICVQRFGVEEEPLGFMIDEVLDAYGGAREVDANCPTCPANAVLSRSDVGLAGCYDLLAKSELNCIDQDLERIVARLDIAPSYRRRFPITTPPWYGLWMQGRPTADQLHCVLRILDAARKQSSPSRALNVFIQAIQVALDQDIPMRWKLEPAGEVEGQSWVIPSHCPDCKAFQDEAKDRCSVCGRAGRAFGIRRRKVRGNRPYWKIERFLGVAESKAFLDRYARHLEEKTNGEDDS